jgi:hypothetical protein
MDKAGITISASHNQMMMMTMAASAADSSSQLNTLGQQQQSRLKVEPDDNDTIAATCQLIAQKGFEPLENVIAMDKW